MTYTGLDFIQILSKLACIAVPYRKKTEKAFHPSSIHSVSSISEKFKP